MPTKEKRSGINKALICKKCGHKVGYVSLKWRFRTKLIFWGVVIAIGTQFFAQLFSDYVIRIVLDWHI